MQHGRDQVRREGLVCFRRGRITNHRFIRGLCFQSAAAENMRSARWNRKHWVSGWLQPPFPAKYSEPLLLINKWRKATVRFQALKIYTCLFPTVLLLVQGIEELRSSGAEVSTLVQTQGRMTSLPGDEWQSLPLSFNSCAWVRGCVCVTYTPLTWSHEQDAVYCRHPARTSTGKSNFPCLCHQTLRWLWRFQKGTSIPRLQIDNHI